MRPSKSEPKLKYSLSKFDDFFDRKNWQDPMFMDTNNPHKTADEALRSYSSVTIQPRAKLTLNMNEKVDKVLADSRKMGMIEKVENKSTKKSLAKISHVSTLPPIKTQVQQTADRLKKIKNELNEYSEKFIKLQKQVSTTQAWINQTREKSKTLMQILGQKGEKQQSKISERKEVTQCMKHDLQVKKYMRSNLKNDLVVISRSRKLLEDRLKNLKIDLGLLNIQLQNYNSNFDKNLNTKVQYQQKQVLISEGIMHKSDVAQQKLTHQRNAERIKQRYQQLQGYDELAFRHETNLRQHFKTLTELRVQQSLSRMINVLHHKYQIHWQQHEKCEALFRMYSSLNESIRNSKGRAIVEDKIKSSTAMQKNSSVLSVGSSKQQQEELSLVQLFENSRETKNLLEQKIKEKQGKIAELESVKNGFYKKWIEKTFEDSLTGGAKPQKKKTNFEKQIKGLYERQKRAEKNKMVEAEVDQWVTRQAQKLNLTFSKKLKKDQKIISIIEAIKKESKNLSKTIKEKSKISAETKGKVVK